MKFKVRIAVLIINIVAMFCGLLIFSVSVRDKMKLAKVLPLEENKYKEVNELFDKYIEAGRNEDFNKLAECTNIVDEVTKEKIKNQNEISEELKVIKCYTIDGYYKDTYVVYVYREDKWKNVNVVVPSIIQYYVCKYKGKLCIYTGEISEGDSGKIEAYYKLTRENPAVEAKLKEVDDQFKKLVETNEKFKELYEIAKQKEMIKNGEATPAPSVVPTVAPTPVPEVSADPNDARG